MSNIQEILKNKINENNLLKFDRETRLIYAFKNPDNELSEFKEIKDINPKSLQNLATKEISKALGFNQINKEKLKNLQIYINDKKNLKIEGLSFDLFDKLKKRKLTRAFGELDPNDKNEILQENWNADQIENLIKKKVDDILIKCNIINSDNFIKNRIKTLIENFNNTEESLNEEQKKILSNLPGQNLLALAKIDNLEYVIDKLTKKNLTSNFLNLAKEKPETIEILAEIKNLGDVIWRLNKRDLTSKFLKLAKKKPEAIKALTKINDLWQIIERLNKKKDLICNFLNLAKEKPEAIEILAKIENLYFIIKELNEKNLTLKFFDLTQEKPETIEILAKINDLWYVIDKLNKKDLTSKFLKLDPIILKDSESIKKTLEIDFEIKMKEETSQSTRLNFLFSNTYQDNHKQNALGS